MGALTVGSFAGPASASFLFMQITDNGNESVASQLLLDVLDYGTEVGLKLTNTGPIASTVAAFYVDDDNGRLGEATAYIGTGVVSFGTPPPGPGDLPSGQSVSFGSDFAATADSAPAVQGVDPGEMLEVRFSLAGAATPGDVFDDLFSGEMRVGLHVISIGTLEGSESFITEPGIPTPGAMSLGVCALTLVVLRWRR